VEDLIGIEGFEEDVAQELRGRARAYLAVRDEEDSRKRVDLGVTDELAAVDGLKPSILVALGEQGVKTLDDLADLAGDELMEIAPEGSLKLERANEIIMAARAHWFADEQGAAGEAGDATDATDATDAAGDAGEAPAGPQEG
jgi:N utilization substance protein A